MNDLFTPDSRKEPRYYQQEAHDAILKAFDAGQRPLLLMATGTGKTIVGAEVVRSALGSKRRSLFLAHRDELINQAISKIAAQTGYTPGKEKANDYAELSDLVVAGSVQTLQRKRLERWKKDNFGLCIVDEAHHSVAKTYQNIIQYFDTAALLGMTATADRSDDKQLGNTYTTVAYEYPLHKAIKEGNLAPIVGRRVSDFNIDLSELKIVAGDYSDDDLANAIQNYIAPMAEAIKEHTHDLKSLVFMPNVESSRIMSEALEHLGIKAGWIAGATDEVERANVLNKYSRGVITHLVSCNVLLEGYDEPSTQAIVMGRPTASRTIYTQAVGRGTRLYPGKDKCLLVEFTYNYSKLKLVTAYELFATAGYGERVQDKAAASQGSGEVNFLDNLEKIHTELYNYDNIIKRLPVKKSCFIEFDPLAMGDLLGIDMTGEFDISYKGHKLVGPATDKQKALLRRYNIANIDNLDKAQASALIDAMSQKGFIPMLGEATDKQKSALRRLGVPVRDELVTKAQAGMLISLMK